VRAYVLVSTLVLATSAGAQSPKDSVPSLPADRWLGADKVKHLFLAGMTTATAFSGGRLAGLERRPALGVGIGVGAIVSIGKEIRDRRVTRHFSARDLVADALGITAYAALLVRTAR
jgi:uncharacterized protein YfiM (DUF2279 family)